MDIQIVSVKKRIQMF